MRTRLIKVGLDSVQLTQHGHMTAGSAVAMDVASDTAVAASVFTNSGVADQ